MKKSEYQKPVVRVVKAKNVPLLTGTYKTLNFNPNDGTTDVLSRGSGSQGDVGFFYYQGTQIPPYRAYLTYNNIQDPAARFMLRIDDNEESGIEEIVNRKPVNQQYYDLQGRLVSGKPTRGIYIKGNRKVFINKQ